jgi:hypothetical protein
MFQERLTIDTDSEIKVEEGVMNSGFGTYRIRCMLGLVGYWDISANRHAPCDLDAANLRKWIV